MRIRRVLALALTAALLALSLLPAAGASGYYDTTDYSGLIGAMEIVNCKSYATLRSYPDTQSAQVARVPLGTVVYNCWYVDDRFTYCVYDGLEGYILNTNLSFLAGPVGYEYRDEDYMGNFEIVNCKSYASLRDYPDTSAKLLARVPLGSIVTNVFYQDERFSYCVFGDQEGYILNSNLSWISGGYGAASSDYVGDAVIVNCASWASMRELPDTGSTRIAKVPLGAVVTDVYIVSERFAQCTYGGLTGYILLDNLGW